MRGALDGGRFRGNAFALPDPPRGSIDAMRDQNTASGLLIDASTAVKRWGGETLDYDVGVAVLMSRRRAPAHPS